MLGALPFGRSVEYKLGRQRHSHLSTPIQLMRHAERSTGQAVWDAAMVVVEVAFLLVVAGGFMLACVLFAFGSL